MTVEVLEPARSGEPAEPTPVKWMKAPPKRWLSRWWVRPQRHREFVADIVMASSTALGRRFCFAFILSGGSPPHRFAQRRDCFGR